MKTQIDEFEFAELFFDGDNDKAQEHIYQKLAGKQDEITLENFEGYLNETDNLFVLEYTDEINGVVYELEDVYGLDRKAFNHLYYQYTTNVENHTFEELKLELGKIYNGHYIDEGSFERIILVEESLIKKLKDSKYE
jgi:hypothetical protein